jgi:hypothetical protein
MAASAYVYAVNAGPALKTGLSTPAMLGSTAQQRMIWTGRSGGFLFQWSATEISARPASGARGVLFSAKTLARRGFAEFLAASKDPETGEVEKCSYDRTFTVLSVVGSIISLRDNNFSACERAAHPGGETRYTAIDLAREGGVFYKQEQMDVDLANPGKVAKLTDIFDETDILNALLADPLVREALAGSESKPRSLGEFVEAFAGASGVTGKHCYSVAEDMFTRFAFHHLENGKVAVRLGLSGAGPCREFLTEIGILLPIPASLKTALAQAESGKEGFLMKDQKRISRERTTTFSFETSAGARR